MDSLMFGVRFEVLCVRFHILPLKWTPPARTGFEPAKTRGSPVGLQPTAVAGLGYLTIGSYLLGKLHMCYRLGESSWFSANLGCYHRGPPHTHKCGFYLLYAHRRSVKLLPDT